MPKWKDDFFKSLRRHVPYANKLKLEKLEDVYPELDRIELYSDKNFCPFPRIASAKKIVEFLTSLYEDRNNLDAGFLLAELATKYIYQYSDKSKRFPVDLEDAKNILLHLDAMKYEKSECEKILSKINLLEAAESKIADNKVADDNEEEQESSDEEEQEESTSDEEENIPLASRGLGYRD